MKNLKQILIGIILLISFSCSITKNQKKGKEIPESFNYETEFTKLKTAIIVPVEINGVSKNFLFDTGALYSIIQRDSTLGRVSTVDGAS